MLPEQAVRNKVLRPRLVCLSSLGWVAILSNAESLHLSHNLALRHHTPGVGDMLPQLVGTHEVCTLQDTSIFLVQQRDPQLSSMPQQKDKPCISRQLWVSYSSESGQCMQESPRGKTAKQSSLWAVCIGGLLHSSCSQAKG